MGETVKVCGKHGALTMAQVRKDGSALRCHKCKLEKDRRWKEANREKHRASAGLARKRDRVEYREKIAQGLEADKPKANEWAERDKMNNPEKYLEWSRRRREKMGPLWSEKEILRRRRMPKRLYDEMRAAQNDLCAICGLPETRSSRTEGNITRLCIDHCHTTGKVRGLLCHACNTALGKFKDSPKLLQEAMDYLEHHSKE